jgi:CDP-diacylglycerol--glycerol-3-phosphate 3-phosphatidyltransferase
MITFATWLTLTRLIISPLILPVLFVYYLPLYNIWLNSGLALIFALLSLTDFLDGYIARNYQQETSLGKALDPLADKFLFYSTLIGLLAAEKIFFYWVLLLIGREFFIMSLRQIALEQGFAIPVSYLGKLKTALQMMTIIVIIINPYHTYSYSYAPGWNITEFILLTVTTTLSLLSGFLYYRMFITKWSKCIVDS